MDEKTYLDVNVFVYWLGGHPTFGPRALKWLSEAEEAPGQFVTSALTIYEVLVIIGGLTGRTLKDSGFVEEALNALMGVRGLQVEPLTAACYTEALELMDMYGLDYEDALHLAVAVQVKAQRIVSNDGDYDRAALRRVF
ncbi:twitching motility protein PilT [Candidatus Bathyarchaeota archaeon RBG_16_57_9]|nr:MAG: twitching motility protein PilT [Candidatus Bathyarchaeota archaeon RBG_16_57_9]OGD55491.1 MAG: twitching motility protein PilT [Candidatus Bathyarchaeota archaeon RBG_13_60_20]